MAAKGKRIHELAKEYSVSSNALIKILKEIGFQAKSHMSVATDDIIKAVQKKFEQKKEEAKKEMQHRAQVKKAVDQKEKEKKEKKAIGTKAKIGGIIVSDSKSPVAGMLRKFEKKQKKKDKRRDRSRQVDSGVVAKSFKSTMADITSTKSKKKYKRTDSDTGLEVEDSNVISVNEFMSVAELAPQLEVKPVEVVAKLFEMGMVATINQRLDIDTIEMIANEYGFEIKQIAEIGDSLVEEEDIDALTTRAPVVTVMGHVDHGKTSLLDYIRKTNVVAGEAGAITQHIGAYGVTHNGSRVTFLDTPGHEAFTAMRARGAQITDIVVLVVAADDNVSPQTIEAIDHARAANVTIIVAINKIDKPGANPDAVRTMLAKHNLLSEDWGGKTIMVEVSAKTGEGIDKLMDMIILQAEMLDLKADSTIRSQGVVIDAHLEKGRGPVATVLIQKGTSHIADSIVTGMFSGRIRTMVDDRGNSHQSIGPSFPAQITGLNGVPNAGDSFMTTTNDQEAKEIALKRSQIKREQETRKIHGGLTLEQIFDRIKEGQIKELKLIIKGDVDGSVEVLADTLGKIATDEVRANIIHKGVGGITESDVLLASASNAIIIGFHVAVDTRARELASTEMVDIKLYKIIYEAEKDIRDALSGLLSPSIEEKHVGSAEVRDTFKVPKIGLIAGCYVKDGKISRSDKVKLVREGTIIFDGKLISLRRFKDDAKEVKEGFECGIGLENYNDIKVGDLIEAYIIVETARTL